ncbi:MAG TPA: calcium-binding EGF-like domain-containing protein [Chitinophagales bacterium]|nr:calcium-binding EGF-like domain-containing protein [Chitinophagales bacterium]
MRSKNFSYSRIAAVGIFILFLSMLFSCKDKCKDIECQNNGKCIDGTCDCPAGYSGPNCEFNVSANFLGTYNVTETCPDLIHYTVNIGVDSFNVSQVKIAGFFNNSFNNLVNATVNQTNITIPFQAPDNDGRVVSGSGSFHPPDEIVWNYTVSGPSGTIDCSNSVWVK